MTTTLPLLILVLVAISLALDVLILASIGNLISRRAIDGIKRDAARLAMAQVAEQLVRAAQETAAQAMSRVPHYDA